MEEEQGMANLSLAELNLSNTTMNNLNQAGNMHSYLGDVDDLPHTAPRLLEPGQTYQLPLLPLDGVVLCPGETLPLRLLHFSDRIRVGRALEAPLPTRRLIAVVCCQHFHGQSLKMERIGCIAEILKMGTDNSSVLAKGRQRFEIVWTTNPNLQEMCIRVLRDDRPASIPQCCKEGAAAWSPWAYRRYDAALLASKAQHLFHAVAPRAKQFQGDPLDLSFWLVANLPLDSMQRQRLLEAQSTVERLLLEISLLSKLSTLFCQACGEDVASSIDICQMNEEGCSAMYVNSYAVVHDIVTVLNARPEAVRLEGEPETEHSWFPGYAWQIAYCDHCDHHLGWRFEAVDAESQPRSFFGLRRAAISSDPRTPGALPWEGGAESEEGSEPAESGMSVEYDEGEQSG